MVMAIARLPGLNRIDRAGYENPTRRRNERADSSPHQTPPVRAGAEYSHQMIEALAIHPAPRGYRTHPSKLCSTFPAGTRAAYRQWAIAAVIDRLCSSSVWKRSGRLAGWRSRSIGTVPAVRSGARSCRGNGRRAPLWGSGWRTRRRTGPPHGRRSASAARGGLRRAARSGGGRRSPGASQRDAGAAADAPPCPFARVAHHHRGRTPPAPPGAQSHEQRRRPLPPGTATTRPRATLGGPGRLRRRDPLLPCRALLATPQC